MPNAPVEHWEQERADWIAAVTRLMDDVEHWAARRDWWVQRETKTVADDDDQIGAYEAPMLRIQTPTARLVVEPIARYVVGALGRIDLAVFPSYRSVPIVRRPDGWWIGTSDQGDGKSPWSEESFFETATRLAARK
ncbi:MAG TPA: hypothetical protein VF306_18685 [Pirellulales bacterium]